MFSRNVKMASNRRGQGKRQHSSKNQGETGLRPSKQPRLQIPNDSKRENERAAPVASQSQHMFETDSAPLEVSVAKFAASRARELEALADAVEHVGGNKLSFQRLPKHMRRRAMSHNIRRIPRRLRERAQAELEKREKKGANKRPSRRYRRRPSNLLSEYQRRQQRHMWLETHIWHAKRFKMTTAWGYRLPVHPSDKSLRACYRATTYHCLLQDVSYECCIQIRGPEQVIVEALSHLTSKDTGLTFAARTTCTGRRWGKVMVYACGTYPRGAIAPVTFLWQPAITEGKDNESGEPDVTVQENSARVLWMWCHPASYGELWNQLTAACAPQSAESGDMAGTLSAERANSKDTTVSLSKDLTANSSPSQGGTEVQVGQLRLCSLKDQLVKFRLTGPASTMILAETLAPANICSEKRSSGIGGEGNEEDSHRRWWQTFYGVGVKEEEFATQVACWERVAKCQSPDEVPPRAVVALTVRDPRILLPSVRRKAAVDKADSAAQVLTWEHFPPEVVRSPVMDEAVREEVARTKMTEQEMNQRRAKLLVPGSELHLGDEESRIPVLLLQRPGGQPSAGGQNSGSRFGVGSGWDLIAPKGWAMAFWVAMVYRGARVGGLRESRSLATRSLQLHFPNDFPDSTAGRQLQRENRSVCIDQHVRRPPAKRVNYQRLGVPAPFHCPWSQLVGEWQEKAAEILNSNNVSAEKEGCICSDDRLSGQAAENPREKTDNEQGVSEKMSDERECSQYTDPYVLRCRPLLRVLQEMAMKVATPRRNPRSKGVDTPGTRLSAILGHPLQKALVHEHLHSLVPLAVSCLSRGVPLERAMICLPMESDLQQLAGDSKFTGPVERLHPRCKTVTAKGMKKKTKRKPSTATSSVSAGKATKEQKAGKNEKVPKESLNPKQLEEKKELLKEPSRVARSMDRPTIGFLTNGDFDLGQGHGAGVGFCSLAGLLAVLRVSRMNQPLLVLVRNPTSRQYRFARLSLHW